MPEPIPDLHSSSSPGKPQPEDQRAAAVVRTKKPFSITTIAFGANISIAAVTSILAAVCMLVDRNEYCASQFKLFMQMDNPGYSPLLSMIAALSSAKMLGIGFLTIAHFGLYATPAIMLRRYLSGNILLLPVSTLALLGCASLADYINSEDCSLTYDENYIFPGFIAYIPSIVVFLLVVSVILSYKLARRWIYRPSR